MSKLFILLSLLFVNTSVATEYVGGESCVRCHDEQTKAWRGSHHDLAMQTATNKSVLGDFNNINFEQFGLVSTFFKKNLEYWVKTDGPNGQLEDYRIKYTFGFNPLQQYLIEFPGGRLQVLDIAWDTRPKSQGGQRWYHLHPDEKIEHDDILHWTGPSLNWNYMCADCHSTNLRKNYFADKETYNTQWTDINVNCEACHGPGASHIDWAKLKSNVEKNKIENKGLTAKLDERKAITWKTDNTTGKPVRSSANNSRAEIQVCARCHSRRSQLTDDHVAGQPFMDGFHPTLLDNGLYYADGQMQDEVYVWGSFRQSKMYKAGVTCSDCHDAHSTRLKAPAEKVCYQCHNEQQYAQKKHHFHQQKSAGSSCIECHMPSTTLMGVDKRHDHSFRIPNPKQSADIGAPNACNQCHQDKTPEWSVEHLSNWLGSTAKPHPYAGIFFAHRSAHINSENLLLSLAVDEMQSGIVRATALSNIGGNATQTTMLTIQQGLLSDDPLIRQGALDAMAALPAQQRILALPLVWDDIRSIRTQAARLLAGYPLPEKVTASQKKYLNRVIQEYIETQEFSAERPQAQTNLGGLYADLGEYGKAESAYRKAIQLQPLFIPAYINFAQSLSEQSIETKAEEILKLGIRNNSTSADLYHALGLSQVRQKNISAAIKSLAHATRLNSDNRRYRYVYAIALHSAGKINLAIKQLMISLQQNPQDVNVLYTLVSFNKEIGRNDLALIHAKELNLLFPGNLEIKALIRILKKVEIK